MTLLVFATAAAIAYTAYHTRVTYWRYAAVAAPLIAVTIVGMGLIVQAGTVNPLVMGGFMTVLLPLKVLAMLRAHQLTQNEQAHAAYRFSTARCPTCGQTKDRATSICARCEWT